jgi:hypothetical protein
MGVACLGAGRVEDAARLAADALALARERGERGDEGWALRLAGDTAAARRPAEVPEAVAAYRQALAIAEALEMRPLAARAHLGLGELAARAGDALEAQARLAQASAIFADLRVDHWLREAERLAAEIAD